MDDDGVTRAAWPDRREPLDWVVAGLVAIACMTQLLGFLGQRSLWLDEAMIALNIRYLSAAELLGRLEYDQVAPVGWLQLQKLLDGLTGQIEIDLRLLGLTCGLVAALTFPWLCARILDRRGVLAATALFAVSSVIAAYAIEVKHYICDFSAAVAITAIGLALLDRPRVGVVRVVALVAAGLAAMLLSFPAVFVLAGVGGVLIARALVDRRHADAALLGLGALIWLALFAAIVVRVSAPQAAGTTVTTGSANAWFLSHAYVPFPPTGIADLRWLLSWYKALMQFAFSGGKLVLTALMLVGAASIARSRPWQAAALFLPAVAGIVASALHQYPLFERTMMFLLPAMIVCAGAGIALIARIAPGGRWLAVAVAALAFGPGLAGLVTDLRRSPPFARMEIKPLLAVLARERAPGDLLYVSQRASASYLLYRPFAGSRGLPWIAGRTRLPEWKCMIAEVPAPARPARIWVIDANTITLPVDTLAATLPVTMSPPVMRRRQAGMRLYVMTIAPRPGSGIDPTLARRCGPVDDLSFLPPPRFSGSWQ